MNYKIDKCRLEHQIMDNKSIKQINTNQIISFLFIINQMKTTI